MIAPGGTKNVEPRRDLAGSIQVEDLTDPGETTTMT